MKRKRVLFCETATIVCGVHPKRVIFKYMLPMAVWKVTFPTKVPLSRKNKSSIMEYTPLWKDQGKEYLAGHQRSRPFLAHPKKLESIFHYALQASFRGPLQYKRQQHILDFPRQPQPHLDRLLWWRIESVHPQKQRFPHIYPQ